MNAEKLPVGHSEPVAGHRKNHFAGRAIVRIIVDGNVVMRVFRFTLGPNFLGPPGIVLVGEDEIKPCRRLALIQNIYVKPFSCFCRLSKVHSELVVAQLECGVFTVYAGAGNSEVRGIKIEMRQSVAQRRERLRHVANHLTLIEIKTQGNAHVLQMVVTAGRIRTVRAGSRCENRSDGQDERGYRHCPCCRHFRRLGRSLV